MGTHQETSGPAIYLVGIFISQAPLLPLQKKNSLNMLSQRNTEKESRYVSLLFRTLKTTVCCAALNAAVLAC